MKGDTDDNEDEVVENSLENSLFLRMIRFGLKQPKGFSYEEIKNGLNLEVWELDIVDKYLHEAYLNAQNRRTAQGTASLETPFYVTHIGGSDYHSKEYRYLISLDSQFKYIDYQELKFARQNAREARALSVKAIKISMFAIIASILTPVVLAVLMSQTVKIDNNQFQYIKSKIDKSEIIASSTLKINK